MCAAEWWKDGENKGRREERAREREEVDGNEKKNAWITEEMT